MPQSLAAIFTLQFREHSHVITPWPWTLTRWPQNVKRLCLSHTPSLINVWWKSVSHFSSFQDIVLTMHQDARTEEQHTKYKYNASAHRRRRRGQGGVPPPQKKKIRKIFSGKYDVKFGHFRANVQFGHFVNFSGKYRAKFGNFVNFSYLNFRSKMSRPQSWLSSYTYACGHTRPTLGGHIKCLAWTSEGGENQVNVSTKSSKSSDWQQRKLDKNGSVACYRCNRICRRLL